MSDSGVLEKYKEIMIFALTRNSALDLVRLSILSLKEQQRGRIVGSARGERRSPMPMGSVQNPRRMGRGKEEEEREVSSRVGV